MSEITIDPMMPIRLEKKNIASSGLASLVLSTRTTGCRPEWKESADGGMRSRRGREPVRQAPSFWGRLLPDAGPGVLEEKAEGIEALDFLPRQATMTSRQH